MVRVKKNLNKNNTETKPSKRKQKSKEYLEYQRYIRSKAFSEVKKALIEKDGYRCRCCGRTEELSAHHSTYDILYHELEDNNLDKMVLLCKYCHRAIHTVPSNYKRFSFNNNTENIEENVSNTGDKQD